MSVESKSGDASGMMQDADTTKEGGLLFKGPEFDVADRTPAQPKPCARPQWVAGLIGRWAAVGDSDQSIKMKPSKEREFSVDIVDTEQ